MPIHSEDHNLQPGAFLLHTIKFPPTFSLGFKLLLFGDLALISGWDCLKPLPVPVPQALKCPSAGWLSGCGPASLEPSLESLSVTCPVSWRSYLLSISRSLRCQMTCFFLACFLVSVGTATTAKVCHYASPATSSS